MLLKTLFEPIFVHDWPFFLQILKLNSCTRTTQRLRLADLTNFYSTLFQAMAAVLDAKAINGFLAVATRGNRIAVWFVKKERQDLTVQTPLLSCVCPRPRQGIILVCDTHAIQFKPITKTVLPEARC
ncbi:MAG: hypothetical protein CMH03_06715 [Marinovum sp.]|nr:hypothetical protein [Marinovum sp.]